MFMPRIDSEKCNQCGECIDVCPTDVFKKDGDETIVADPADCIGCDSCIAVCEQEAVSIGEI